MNQNDLSAKDPKDIAEMMFQKHVQNLETLQGRKIDISTPEMQSLKKLYLEAFTNK